MGGASVMTWPVALHVDTSIIRVAPSDLTSDSPLVFLEFQWLRNAAGEEGMRVLYATPDRVTHYAWPKGFDLPPGDAPLGAGVGLNEPADFRRATYTTGADGVHVDVDFTDALGRRLVCELHQGRPWRGFDFVAPPAAGIERPNSFFFPYLHAFGFVPRPLDYRASFDGRPLRLKAMPFLWNGRPALAQKACDGLVVVEFLRDDAAPITPDAPGLALDAGALERWVTPTHLGEVVLGFDPPLPPIEDLDAAHTSRWELSVDGDFVAGGAVAITPDADGWGVRYSIDRSWRGIRQRGWAWVLIRMIRPLLVWPRSYSWTGRLTDADGVPQLQGRWTNAKVRR